MKFKFSALLLLFLLATTAHAKIIVNLPLPAPQYGTADTQFNLYQAGGQDAVPTPGYVDTRVYLDHDVYRYIHTSNAANDIRDPSNLVFVDVQTDKTFSYSGNQRLIVMLSTDDSAGSEVPILYAGARPAVGVVPASCSSSAGTACQSTAPDTKFYSASIAKNQVIRIGFSLLDLCTSNSVTAGATGICGATGGINYQGLNGVMLSQTMKVNIAVVPDNTSTHAKIILPSDATLQPNAQLETQAFTLYVSDIAPSIDCNTVSTESQFYFPGDQQLFLKIANFTQNTLSGPPMKNLVFLGKEGTTPAVPPTGLTTPGSDVIDNPGFTGNEVKVTSSNFINTTTGADHIYVPVVHAENVAGMISDITLSCVPNTAGWNVPGVQTQNITGVLTESKCFIATAAYHDGRAAPVMMLRKFRDHVLSKSSWGRKFIETYYEHSPAWAEWAWDKPIIRSLALKILTPLELAAWVTLKLSEGAQVDTPQASSSEPYIDRLKQAMPAEKHPTTGSYTEEERKRLDLEPKDKQPTSSENYTEHERENALKGADGNPIQSSEGYSEKKRAELPPEAYRSNPSELIKQGKDRKLGFQDVPPIKSAISLRMGVSPGMEVTAAGALAENSFANIYGEGWQPELLIHYERQMFHSENFGSFGLTGEFGVSYAEGFGRLQFQFAGTTQSQTKFSFLQVPLLVGANYRFNFFRVLRPYVGAGAGTMLYAELRNDEKQGHRGYSFIYNTNAGLSLLLDFLDGDTARDSYLSLGVQHTYLFAEYFYMNTLSGNVTFTRSGIYSGFLFEL